MRPLAPLITTAAFAILFSGISQAGGPFGLFDGHGHGCDSAGCDAGCCDSDSCQAECDSCCDSGCSDRGCDGCSVSDLFGCLGSSDCNPCGPQNYVSLLGGWNKIGGYQGQQLAPPVLSGTFSDGWSIGGAMGRRVHRSFRLEMEFAFRSNTADQWAVGPAVQDWSGHLFTYTGMANVFYDFNQFTVVGIKPYVGTGIGLAIFDGEFQTLASTIEIDGAAFAYQFIVGASKSVSQNVDFFVEYRYFATSDLDVVNDGTGTVIDNYDPEVDNVFVGLRFWR